MLSSVTTTTLFHHMCSLGIGPSTLLCSWNTPQSSSPANTNTQPSRSPSAAKRRGDRGPSVRVGTAVCLTGRGDDTFFRAAPAAVTVVTSDLAVNRPVPGVTSYGGRRRAGSSESRDASLVKSAVIKKDGSGGYAVVSGSRRDRVPAAGIPSYVVRRDSNDPLGIRCESPLSGGDTTASPRDSHQGTPVRRKPRVTKCPSVGARHAARARALFQSSYGGSSAPTSRRGSLTLPNRGNPPTYGNYLVNRGTYSSDDSEDCGEDSPYRAARRRTHQQRGLTASTSCLPWELHSGAYQQGPSWVETSQLFSTHVSASGRPAGRKRWRRVPELTSVRPSLQAMLGYCFFLTQFVCVCVLLSS